MINFGTIYIYVLDKSIYIFHQNKIKPYINDGLNQSYKYLNQLNWMLHDKKINLILHSLVFL